MSTSRPKLPPGFQLRKELGHVEGAICPVVAGDAGTVENAAELAVSRADAAVVFVVKVGSERGNPALIERAFLRTCRRPLKLCS